MRSETTIQTSYPTKYAFLMSSLRILAGLCVALLLLVSPPATAQQSVPALTGRVMDLADVLRPETENFLETTLRLHEDSTSNQLAILTIQSLEGEAIEEFSLRTARSWQLGQAEKDNGVLLVVAVDDRRLRIEVGFGLEGALPDALAGRIIRNDITPHFRDGDYDAGVRAGVRSILSAIEGEYDGGPEGSSSSGGEDFFFYTFFGIFGLFFFGLPLLGLARSLLHSGGDRWGPFITYLRS